MKYPKRRRLIFITFFNIFLLAILIACTALINRCDMTASVDQYDGAKNTSQDGLNAPHDNASEKPAPGTDEKPAADPEAEQTSDVLAENTGPKYSIVPYYKHENASRYEKYGLENPDLDEKRIVADVNIGLDNSFYGLINEIKNYNDITVLVNKYNKLPDNYEPELEQLEERYCVPGRGAQHLRKEAADAFRKMHEDAKKEGLNINAYGTYRSIPVQQKIWENAINSGRTKEDVDSLNSRGGHSEHHTGLAVDVVINDYSVLDTREYEWYKDRAHEYGFIIRYPKGKENITGYKYEPWHLRYVGPETAKEVYNSGLTYEEYYVTVLEPSMQK
ncbi:MAG TPA: M15 family metallopeptidase [Clostridia bacterium]